MNWAEVFAAIQAGTVDGAICCTAQSTYTVFAQSDVGKYFIPYNAFVEASTYDVSKKSLGEARREAASGRTGSGGPCRGLPVRTTGRLVSQPDQLQPALAVFIV